MFSLQALLVTASFSTPLEHVGYMSFVYGNIEIFDEVSKGEFSVDRLRIAFDCFLSDE